MAGSKPRAARSQAREKRRIGTGQVVARMGADETASQKLLTQPDPIGILPVEPYYRHDFLGPNFGAYRALGFLHVRAGAHAEPDKVLRARPCACSVFQEVVYHTAQP